MSYVIYHKETTVIYPDYRKSYATERAAKSALTKAATAGKVVDKSKYAIADRGYFADNIEKVVTRKKLMSGKEIQVSVNSPAFMDPSCESYWSM